MAEEWTAGQVRELMTLLLAERDRQYAQRIDAQERAVAAALSAAKEAVEKAESAPSKRFESVNAFREQLAVQARDFVTRAEYEATRGAMVEKVDTLRARADKTGGLALGLSNGWAVIVAAIGVVLAIVAAWRR